MDISSRFSLVDFLAYFFPGILGTLGLYLILLFTPLESILIQIKFDISLAILVFVISYAVGVILSGISEILIRTKFIGRIKDHILICEYQKELQTAFNDVFCSGEKREEKWSAANFYLCRSLIIELMPNVSDFVLRQSSLRQLRLNLIPAVVLWSIAGILWENNLLIAEFRMWGFLISVALAGFIIFTLFNRMKINEEREVREVQTAFLAGYNSGLFSKSKKTG